MSNSRRRVRKVTNRAEKQVATVGQTDLLLPRELWRTRIGRVLGPILTDVSFNSNQEDLRCLYNPRKRHNPVVTQEGPR